MDTLASQAFGNRNNYLAGLYFHRAIIISTLIFLPQLVTLYFAEDILQFFGQSAVSAKYASVFIKAYLPGVWAYCQTEVLRRFLSNQGVFDLMMKFQIATLMIHVGVLHVLVNVLDMGLIGIALSISINHNLTFFSIVGYI